MTAPLSRRRLLSSAATLAASACAGPAVHLASRAQFDLLIRGGTVFDGTGAPGVEADVGIRSGRVVAIDHLADASARTVVEAKGLAVAPGFVDLHSHADWTLFKDPTLQSVVRQGVTTVILGQDGNGWRTERPDKTRQFTTLAEFYAAVDRLPPAVNVASMVGLGDLRAAVVGLEDRPATPAEVAAMVALAEQELADGACGASTGLEYTPGSFASREELAALCRPLRARGLPYATHMRNEDDRLLEAIEESIQVANAAGCKLQISHLKTQGARNWAKLDAALATIDNAAVRGLDVAFDRYPYIAFATRLFNLFPTSSRDGDRKAFLARLSDPATAGPLRAVVLDKVDALGGWENVMVASVANAADAPIQGRRVGSYAAERKLDPYELIVGLLVRSVGDVGMVGFGMSEPNLVRILAHPRGMVCSDGGAYALEGPARSEYPHPRALGSFPRVLAVYVREKRALTLAEAIHKMSGFPASRVGLHDRGRLAVGMAGDAVVFDPATVRDRATFEQPLAYPEGIQAVVVNGQLALHHGERPAERSGRTLTPAKSAAALRGGLAVPRSARA